MNFLAHTFLSCQDEELLTGNFMADFISNNEAKNLKPQLLSGVHLHKKIDSFTDQHDGVRDSIKLVRPSQGKYSPVVVDILFDYFLTKNWASYSNENMRLFTDRVYNILLNNQPFFPERLKDLLPKMIDDDFLMSCSNEDRLRKTFERVKRRAKFDNNFDKVHIDLAKYHDVLDSHFNYFFPHLIAHINECQDG